MPAQASRRKALQALLTQAEPTAMGAGQLQELEQQALPFIHTIY